MAKPEHKIDRGMGFPIRKPTYIKYPWHEMKVGDSFPVPAGKYDTVANAARDFGKRHGRKFSIRTIATGVRIWRTA